MKRISTYLVISLASLTLAVGACKKKEEAPAAPAKTEEPAATTPPAEPAKTEPTPPAADPATTPPAADPAATTPPAADPNADFIKVVADHVDKTKGKVDVNFTKFAVTKADFDPAKIEGGTATFEIDLTSVSTGIAKRDGHLQSPDYMDAAKFPKAVVTIDNVKKTADKQFTADANVDIHGVQKKYPVKFEVVDATADSIRIKGEHTFPRLDFSIGKAEGDGVEKDLTIALQLTLKKT